MVFKVSKVAAFYSAFFIFITLALSPIANAQCTRGGVAVPCAVGVGDGSTGTVSRTYNSDGSTTSTYTMPDGTVTNVRTVPTANQENQNLINNDQGIVSKKKMSKADISADPCLSVAAKAENDCVAGGTAAKMAQAMQMGAGAMGGTSAYAACKAMKAQGFTAMGGAAMTYIECQHIISDCTARCGAETTDEALKQKYDDALQHCTDLKGQVKMSAAIGGMTGMAAMMSASNCDKVIQAQEAGMCTLMNGQPNPAAANNPNCPQQYCANPANAKTPTCIDFQGMCQGNPQIAGCENMGGGALAFGQGDMPNADMSGSGDVGNGQFAGYQANKPQGGDAGAGGGGSGMPGIGGGNYPGGPGDKQNNGSGGGSGLPQVGVGVGGGSGGGSVAMGNPINGNNGGRGDGGKLDLSAFLPKDGARGIASVNDLMSKGISGANDLSNFEKITRRMNMKRKFLLP